MPSDPCEMPWMNVATARARVGALLDEMTKTGWKSGDPLPGGDAPLC